MVQAAAEGVIDFSQARIGGIRWMRKINLLLDHVSRKNRREIELLAYQRYLVFLAARFQSKEVMESALESVFSIPAEIESTYYPEGESIEKKQFGTMLREGKSAWEQNYGQLEDPEVQKKIAETVRGMEALRRQTAGK